MQLSPGAKLFLCDAEGNPAMEMAGYGVTGTYMIRHKNGGDPKWQARCKYIASDTDKPPVVMFPAYRMRGLGAGCTRFGHMLNDMGFSVLLLNYTHMDENKSEVADISTMTTQIADARAAIEFLGMRDHIQCAISYGTNIAMQVMNENTMNTVIVLPAPDRTQKMVYPFLDMDDVRKRGYIRQAGQNGIDMKYTARFLQDSLQYTAFNPGLADFKRKNAVHLIIAGADDKVPQAHSDQWIEFLRSCGMSVSVDIVPGLTHMIVPSIIERAIAAIPELYLATTPYPITATSESVLEAASFETLERLIA